MILPAIRDPRLVSIRRGGLLAEADHHQLLALWAATCSEHVLRLFEESDREDDRPRAAIEAARAIVLRHCIKALSDPTRAFSRRATWMMSGLVIGALALIFWGTTMDQIAL